MTFTVGVWMVTAISLFVSYVRDTGKTKAGLRKAWASFENILPQFAGIIILISIMLAFITPATVGRLVGGGTGIWGMLLTSLIGAVTLVPGFIAFPLAKSLVALGAGIPQVAVLVSTLMMVGLVTLPLEIRYFGRRVAISRNVLAYAASFAIAYVIGAMVR